MADFRENIAMQLGRQGSFALLRCFSCDLWIWESFKKWDFENLLKFKRLNLFVNNNEDLLRLRVLKDKHSHLRPTEWPLRLIFVVRNKKWYLDFLLRISNLCSGLILSLWARRCKVRKVRPSCCCTFLQLPWTYRLHCPCSDLSFINTLSASLDQTLLGWIMIRKFWTYSHACS